MWCPTITCGKAEERPGDQHAEVASSTPVSGSRRRCGMRPRAGAGAASHRVPRWSTPVRQELGRRADAGERVADEHHDGGAQSQPAGAKEGDQPGGGRADGEDRESQGRPGRSGDHLAARRENPCAIRYAPVPATVDTTVTATSCRHAGRKPTSSAAAAATRMPQIVNGRTAELSDCAADVMRRDRNDVDRLHRVRPGQLLAGHGQQLRDGRARGARFEDGDTGRRNDERTVDFPVPGIAVSAAG